MEKGEDMSINEENMIGYWGMKEGEIVAEEEEEEIALKEEKVIELMLWVDCYHIFCRIDKLN